MKKTLIAAALAFLPALALASPGQPAAVAHVQAKVPASWVSVAPQNLQVTQYQIHLQVYLKDVLLSDIAGTTTESNVPMPQFPFLVSDLTESPYISGSSVEMPANGGPGKPVYTHSTYTTGLSAMIETRNDAPKRSIGVNVNVHFSRLDSLTKLKSDPFVEIPSLSSFSVKKDNLILKSGQTLNLGDAKGMHVLLTVTRSDS